MRTLADFLRAKKRLVELGLITANETSLDKIKKAACLALARDQISDQDFLAGARPPKPTEEDMSTTTTPDPKEVFAGGARVKSGSESYATTKSVGTHRRTGKPMLDHAGREVQTASERERAELGAFLKLLARKSLGAAVVDPPDHERDLLNRLVEQEEWAGTLGGQYERGLGKLLGAKALLDDNTSGGLEIAPIVFDAMLITTPLLNGEIFPFLQTVDIPRGRRVEGASIGNVTLNSGGADNTEIPLFNTANFIAAFDTTIFAVDFACEIGRDFLSDSPLNVGSVIQELIGEKLAAWLDEQPLLGDGTTEPEGIFVGSGTTSVASDNGAPGPWTLSDYYDTMFGVGKVYRQSAQNPCFFSNDTTYARGRQIKIDPAVTTTDQRPVFGIESANSYMSLDWPHKIQNTLSNRRLGFGALKRYRMYRRVGMEFSVETGGSTLARKNLALIIARARFGGQMANPDAFALITDGQS